MGSHEDTALMLHRAAGLLFLSTKNCKSVIKIGSWVKDMVHTTAAS